MDERLGLPSASEMDRLVRCTGSWLLQKDSPYEDESASAERGTIIHAVLAGEADISTLNEGDQKTVDIITQIEMRIVAHLNLEGADIIRETRFWIEKDTFKQYSAKPDVVYIGDRLGVFNYKTGIKIVPIEDNWQMICEAITACQTYGYDAAWVILIHPLYGDMFQMKFWSKEELIERRNYLEAKVRIATTGEGAELVIGDIQCTYCKAENICPKRRQQRGRVINDEMASHMLEPTPEWRSYRLDIIQFLRTELEKERSFYIKQMVDQPGSIPGWNVRIDKAGKRHLKKINTEIK